MAAECTPVDTSPAGPDTEVIERVARYMAAEDWLEDSSGGDWWDKRSPEFREDYRTSARRVIAIVRGGEQR